MSEYSFGFKPLDDQSEIIAHVANGKNKGKNIFLNKETPEDIKHNKMDIFYEWLGAKSKTHRLNQKSVDILVKSVVNDEPPSDFKLKSLYNEFQKEGTDNHEIMLKDSELDVVPYQGDGENVQRDVIFIGACSGAGKTTWVSRYCLLFNKLFPKSKIWLFSCKPLEDEHQFKKVKNMKQIPLDDETLEEVIQSGNYQYLADEKHGQSLVIFDDFDAIPKKTEKLLDTILNSCLQVGRSKRIYCIVSKHSLNAGNKTKIVWTEANKILLFPCGLSRYSIIYACQHYLGLDKKIIEKILAHKSRWICIHNHLPKYAVTQNSLYFLN
jgi:hypothetical protein